MNRQADKTLSLNDFARLLSRNGTQAGIYLFAFVAISLALGLFLPATNLQLFCFALLGIANLLFFYKTRFLAGWLFLKARLAFTCLIFIVMGLVLFAYYYISGNGGVLRVFAGSGVLLFPFLVYQGWVAFMAIPVKTYPVWYLPDEQAAQTASMQLPALNNLQVQLAIIRRTGDMHYNNFPVTTPGKQKLGKIFERFTEEQRLHGLPASIETGDSQGRAYGWQFYERKWAGLYRRHLNPAMNLFQNGIKPNAIIEITRCMETYPTAGVNDEQAHRTKQ